MISKVVALHNKGPWNCRWIAYCEENKIPHKVVNCYSTDIIDQIKDCAGLMWSFNQANPHDILMARNVLNAAELMGLKVFPDYYTNWHFDDKLSQKYLFEALSLPVVPAWAFFERDKALEFIETCEMPIVAKLRHGAGSYNVRLLKNRSDARTYINRMFGNGYSPAPAMFADAVNKFRVAVDKGGIKSVISRAKKAPNFIRESTYGRKYFGHEKGYVYLQKFIPGNKFDVRVTVIGNRAWIFKRMVRKGDFRASGSGMFDFNTSDLPSALIVRSINIAGILHMQSCSFDWIRDRWGNWFFVEISMGTVDEVTYCCNGYWDRELYWHEGHFYPSIEILKDFIENL